MADTVDTLALDMLIPRSIMQRHVAMTREHKHVIISGPASCGKSLVAGKLAGLMSQNVERISLTRDNSQEQITEMMSQMTRCQVVVIDNLQYLDNLDAVLQQLSSSSNIPYIIGESISLKFILKIMFLTFSRHNDSKYRIHY